MPVRRTQNWLPCVAVVVCGIILYHIGNETLYVKHCLSVIVSCEKYSGYIRLACLVGLYKAVPVSYTHLGKAPARKADRTIFRYAVQQYGR